MAVLDKDLSLKVLWLGWITALFLFILSGYLYQSRLDVDVHDFMVSWQPFASIQDVWGFFSWLGEDHVQAIICIVVAIFYYKKANYKMARVWYSSIVIFLLSGIAVQIFKHIIGRPRPKMLPEYDVLWFEVGAKWHSMPSGHTMTTMAWLACLLPFYKGKFKAFIVLFACAVGFSRVGIGAHYLSDVLIGGVLGYVFGMMLRNKFNLYKEVR